MKTLNDLIEDLAALGVGFTCSHAGPSGTITLPLAPGDVIAFKNDPNAVIAAHYGVSVADLANWYRSDYSVHCAGNTKSGHACKNIVENGHRVSPARWAALAGSCCHLHE